MFGVAIAGGIALGTLGIAKEMVNDATNDNTKKKKKKKSKSLTDEGFDFFGEEIRI